MVLLGGQLFSHADSTQSFNKGRRLEMIDKDGNPTCFLCPSDSVVISQAICNCTRMPKPVVRSCSNRESSGQNQRQEKGIQTRVVRGPLPGSLLHEGSHQVVLRLFSHHLAIYDCHYTQIVVSSAVCNPPRVAHSHVTCSYNGGNLTSTTCKYVCNEGYTAAISSVPYFTWNCSNGDVAWNKNAAPKCIKRTSPVALDGQCNDIHLTLSAVSEVDAGIELATPQFRLSETNRSQSSIRVACNINSVARPGLFQRQCVARNTETGAKTSCSYKILVTRSKCSKLAAPLNGELKCSRQEKTIACVIDCSKGHSLYVTSINSSSSVHISGKEVALCDLNSGLWTVSRRPIHSADLQCKLDAPVRIISASFHFQMTVESCAAAQKVFTATRNALLEQNAHICRQANCSLMTTTCHPCIKSISNRCDEPLQVNWTIVVNKDYHRKAESLIHKLKVDTEEMIRTDSNFHRLIEKAGGKINQRSFKVAQLDLVCPTPGYVFNATTNKCISDRTEEEAAVGDRKSIYWTTSARKANIQSNRIQAESQSGHPILTVKEKSYPKKSDLCKWGLTGSHCKTSHSSFHPPKKVTAICGSSPCLNGGECIENGGSFTCKCRGKFRGQFCQYITCPAMLEFMLCSQQGQCVIETTSGRRRCY